MYNPKIISSRLSKVQAKLPFELEYHTLSQVESAIDFINNLIDLSLYEESVKGGKAKTQIVFKDLASKKEFESPEIQQFIQNELIISQFDCFYWMNRYYQISNIENKFIQYQHLIPQKIWANIMSKLEGLGRAIRLLIEKARQTSCTTFFQGVGQHKLQFYPDVKSMIASKDETSTGKMAGMFIDSLNRQPFWIRSQVSSFQTGGFWQFENGSRLDLGWGTQRSLGKGTTTTFAHLSEIALYKYPIEAIENALIRGMHETTSLVQIFEGTAEARDDWFHKKVKETIIAMEKFTTSLYFSFIPYFLREDIYPPSAYITGRSEAFAKFIPSKETLIHAKKAETWVKSNTEMREIVGSNYKMPIETMFWYETERNAAINEDRLGVFLSQCPADWEEAFQHAGRTIYPIEIITHHSDKAQGIEPEVYKLKGDENEVPQDFWPTKDEILPSGRIISITTSHNSSIPPSYFQLIQVKFEGWDKFDPVNKILIWEHPLRNHIYGSSTDTSDGLGRKISDNAVHEVYRKGTVESSIKQVCEFVSPELSMARMWPFVLSINTYYSGEKQIQWACEVNKGYELQNALINRGWWNLYNRIDESNPSASQTNKFGFLTTPNSRTALINHINAMIIGKWIDIYSVPLISEMKDLQKVTHQTSQLNIQRDKILGKIDDRFMASGICIYMLDRDQIMGFEKAMWEQRRKEEDNKLEFKSFVDYEVSYSENFALDNHSFGDIVMGFDPEFNEILESANDFSF